MSRPIDPELIRAGLSSLGQRDLHERADLFVRLLEELRRWNARMNLTAILDAEDMVRSHIMDSLAVRSFLEGARVIDVGTGAGFPGLPLAIAEPGIEFELLDSHGRKLAFVQHVIGELGLGNATAVNSRAEDYAPGKRFDTVVARALAPTPRLLEVTAHLVGEDGVLLALKGKDPAAELETIDVSSGWQYDVTELTVPGLESHARHLVRLRRTTGGET